MNACGIHYNEIVRRWKSSFKIFCIIRFSMPDSAFNSSSIHPIQYDAWLTTEFYRHLCYNCGAHCPLLQCLLTTSIIPTAFILILLYHHLNVREKIIAMTLSPTLVHTGIYKHALFSLTCELTSIYVRYGQISNN